MYLLNNLLSPIAKAMSSCKAQTYSTHINHSGQYQH
jgi:hypothetical protein